MLVMMAFKMLFNKKLAQSLFSTQTLRSLSKMSANKLVKVQVKQGLIVGNELFTPNGTIFHSYKGIPYSVPPLGNLRFMSPVPLERFDQPELDCTKERDISHQKDPMTQSVEGSENCLFLNVYAPKSDKTTQPLPVMVYIHGGGYFFGNGNSDYLFPQHFMEEDVIVVTLNYRLGALGFLCFPEAGIWGNAGLKDQRVALEWVKENIARFNGDPNNITLFGESAGASSVHLHTYADHAHTLFHKAIMQSGTANMEWVFQSNPEHKTRRLAQLLGCQSSDSQEILNFLQSPKITPLHLLAKTVEVLTPDERRRGLPLTFKPVIEDAASPDKFVIRPIQESLQQVNTLHMPTIMGYNSAEGLAMLVNAARKLGDINKDLERFVPRNIPLSPEIHKNDLKELALKMRKFYFGGKNIDENQLNALCDVLSDYHFTVDMQNAAKLQVTHQPDAPLYFYIFDYVGKRNLYKFIFQFEHLRGACHGDELFYLFQMAGDTKPLNEDDYMCVKRLCRLWANFARYGKPTIGIEQPIIDFDWNPIRKSQDMEGNFVLNYLHFGKDCKMKSNPDNERIQFWREIYNDFKPTDYSRLSAKL